MLGEVHVVGDLMYENFLQHNIKESEKVIMYSLQFIEKKIQEKKNLRV